MILTVLSSFCIVACFMTGIYSAIISYHFRNTKRTIWFAILCIALGLNVIAGMNFPLAALTLPVHDISLGSHIYIATNVFVAMCLHIYSEFLFPARHAKFHSVLNYMFFLLAALCMLVPDFLFLPVYLIVSIGVFYAYIYSLCCSIAKIIEGETAYIYPAIAYGLFILSAIVVYTLFTQGIYLPNPKIAVTPILIILHIVMTIRLHGLSVAKTKKLSASLSETIERINHSDTALMCTQMKSDFLYKSLSLISDKCDEDPYTAEDLTISLSKYLRHTLNFQQLKGIVPLTNEIELTKAFVAIERERFPRLTVEYRFPSPLPELHVPPLSIQPLVENAIDHGFDGTEEAPRITITIIPFRDYYHIDVSDNGKGMDEETVRNLTDALCDSARIGIYNIHTRLINLFGKGLVIQSAPGVGSSVSFVVPPNAHELYEAGEVTAE